MNYIKQLEEENEKLQSEINTLEEDINEIKKNQFIPMGRTIKLDDLCSITGKTYNYVYSNEVNVIEQVNIIEQVKELKEEVNKLKSILGKKTLWDKIKSKFK